MSAPNPMLVPNTKHVKRILYKGMSGEDVKYLQEMLDDLNSFYKFCPSRTLKASGYFGDETARFLKFFQYKSDLIPDSYFDKATSDALEKWYANYIVDLSLQAEAANNSKPTRNLFKLGKN